MAEVFGVRSDFAIEAGVEPLLEPPSAVWGRMCVWCNGVPLGDLANGYCALFPAYHSFRWLLSNLSSLWEPELAGLSDAETWNVLDGLLYGFHGDEELRDDRPIERLRADWAAWNKFNFLTNWGEQFDGCKSFTFCPPGEPVRILYRYTDGQRRGVTVSRAAIVSASDQFVQWFERHESRLHGSAT